METVALQALGRRSTGIGLEFSRNVEAGSCASTFEVLSQDKGLGKAAVIIAAEVNSLGILANNLTIVSATVRIFVSADHIESTEFTRSSSGEDLIVQRRLVAFLTILIEGVLERALHTGKLRGLVGNHVVGTAGGHKTEDLVVAAVKSVAEQVDDVIRTGAGTNGTHAAHGERTEVGVDGKRSFTVEETTGRLERAIIRLEAVFELEANLQAIAEIFRTLEAEAADGVDAAVKSELVHFEIGSRITISDVVVRVHQTSVDNTVHRNLRSHGSAGKSAENGDSSERFLKHNFSLF